MIESTIPCFQKEMRGGLQSSDIPPLEEVPSLEDLTGTPAAVSPEDGSTLSSTLMRLVYLIYIRYVCLFVWFLYVSKKRQNKYLIYV